MGSRPQSYSLLQARQLLHVIEAYEAERGELARDAKSLIGQVFE